MCEVLQNDSNEIKFNLKCDQTETGIERKQKRKTFFKDYEVIMLTSRKTISRSGHLSLTDGHIKQKLWRKNHQEANSKAKNNWGAIQ